MFDLVAWVFTGMLSVWFCYEIIMAPYRWKEDYRQAVETRQKEMLKSINLIKAAHAKKTN